MISIQQQPYGLQPVNTQHIWTIYDDEYTGFTNYKYVVDFYLDPYEEGWEKMGRIKLRPNSYGKASFNGQEIIKNYIAPNPRKEVSGTTEVIADNMLNYDGFTFTNELNDHSEYYEKLRQVGNYKILIGKEYTSGGTTTIDIPTDYYTPTYSIAVSLGPLASIGWTNANGWEDLVSDYALTAYTWNSGFTWTHETSGGGFVDGGSGLGDALNYTPSVAPSTGDIFYVYSNANGCGFWYEYQFEGTGWDLRGDYSQEYTFDGCNEDHSNFRTIWLGTSPNLINTIHNNPSSVPNNKITDDLYEFISAGSYPLISPFSPGYENQDWSITKGSFLNTYGGKFIRYDVLGANGFYETSPYFFTRKHHYDCPIVLNWFNGVNGGFKNTYDFLYEGTGNTGNLLNFTTQHTPLSDGDDTFTPSNELIQSFIKTYIDPTADKLVFMISNSPEIDSQYVWEDGLSMGMVYDLYGNDCLDDPIHFLFINRHGGFDTYTFGQKNIRSHSTSISTYAKNGITDTTGQRWGDYQFRNTPYDQTTTTSVETQSTFVDENDVPIIQDLFLSPYVWRIQTINDRYYLVPIQITSNSVEEYKSRYNKLYQYDMTFTYNPINQFNNPL